MPLLLNLYRKNLFLPVKGTFFENLFQLLRDRVYECSSTKDRSLADKNGRLLGGNPSKRIIYQGEAAQQSSRFRKVDQ